MAEEAKWKRITAKKYQRQTAAGEWLTVDMPYGKVELLFNEFIGEGGIISPLTGMIMTDITTLISKFGTVGAIVLTEYDAQGEVVTKGNCASLDPEEVPVLFEIATDVIENFTKAISTMRGLGTANLENTPLEKQQSLPE